LAEDWGFWYDATSNLNLTKEHTRKYLGQGKLEPIHAELVCERVDRLLRVIEEQPKSKKWKLRAAVGAKKPWYREVEEVMR
jgi:hypothetical protein